MEGIRVTQRCIKNLNYNAENSIMEIHIGDRVAEIELVSKEDNKVVLTIDGKPFEADVDDGGKWNLQHSEGWPQCKCPINST